MHTQSEAAQQAAQQRSLRYWRELFENYLHASQEVLVMVHAKAKAKRNARLVASKASCSWIDRCV